VSQQKYQTKQIKKCTAKVCPQILKIRFERTKVTLSSSFFSIANGIKIIHKITGKTLNSIYIEKKNQIYLFLTRKIINTGYFYIVLVTLSLM